MCRMDSYAEILVFYTCLDEVYIRYEIQAYMFYVFNLDSNGYSRIWRMLLCEKIDTQNSIMFYAVRNVNYCESFNP